MDILREKIDLFTHMNWADSTVWQKLSGVEEIDRINFIFHHIHSVQHAYLALWLEEEIKLEPFESFKNEQEIAYWGFQYYQRLDKYLATIKVTDLEKSINIPWTKYLQKKIGRTPDKTILSQMMDQVILHSAHHRAQINAIMRENDLEPPLIDYIMWIWLGKPDSKWPEEFSAINNS